MAAKSEIGLFQSNHLQKVWEKNDFCSGVIAKIWLSNIQAKS